MTKTPFPAPLFPLSRHGGVLLALAALMAATPLSLRLDPQRGTVTVQASIAEARGGHDDAGRDDRGGRDDRRDDRSGDDRRGGRHGADDDSDDRADHRRGRGTDEHRPDDRRPRGTATRAGRQVVEIERSANHIEVHYANGWKEEIEFGIYERKNPAGRTVTRRTATTADYTRLRGLR